MGAKQLIPGLPTLSPHRYFRSVTTELGFYEPEKVTVPYSTISGSVAFRG